MYDDLSTGEILTSDPPDKSKWSSIVRNFVTVVSSHTPSSCSICMVRFVPRMPFSRDPGHPKRRHHLIITIGGAVV